MDPTSKMPLVPTSALNVYDQPKPAESLHSAERLTRYRDYRDFYDGMQWYGPMKQGDLRLVFNYARVFVNKCASYLLSKGVGFDARSLDDAGIAEEGAEAETRARRVEAFLQEVSDWNNLPMLDLEVAQEAGQIGDGAYTLRWDKEASMVRIARVDPAGLDARWRQDDLTSLVWVCQQYWLMPVELTEAQREKFVAGHPAEFAEYGPLAAREEWTEKRWTLTLAGVEIDGGVNPYGMVPYIIFPNLRKPGEFWGESDLVDLKTLQQELNMRISIFARILQVAGNPVAVISGAKPEETEHLRLVPNALWTLPEGAEASVLALLEAGGAEAHFKYIELVYRAMHDISEMPRTSFGDSQGASSQARSGVALEIEMQPLLHKLRRKQAILTAAYLRRAYLALKMADVHGVKLPKARIEVVWPPVLPQDRQALVEQEVKLVGAKIHSHTTAMDKLGETDPTLEFQRVLDEAEQVGVVTAPADAVEPPNTGAEGVNNKGNSGNSKNRAKAVAKAAGAVPSGGPV
jgi:hypothetical protein